MPKSSSLGSISKFVSDVLRGIGEVHVDTFAEGRTVAGVSSLSSVFMKNGESN